MQKAKLKPCPFCGGEVTETRRISVAPFYFYKCNNLACGAVVSFDNFGANINPPMARKNWNRRAP